MGCVVLVAQLRTALEQEVYDEELNTGVQAWRGTDKEGRKQKDEKTDAESFVQHFWMGKQGERNLLTWSSNDLTL